MSDELDPPSINLRANLRADADFLVFLSGAYMFSAALFAAVEVGLFDALEAEPATTGELAPRVGASARGLAELVSAMAAIGLVEQDELGVCSNRPLASQLLVTSSPQSIRAFLLYQHRVAFPLFGRLAAAVRSGEPQLDVLDRGGGSQDYYARLARAPDALTLFLDAMDTAARGVGTSIAKQADLGPGSRVLDIGGGGGRVAVELVEAVPGLEVTLLDQPEVCAIAARNLADRGFGARVRVVPGDFLRELPVPARHYDAVLLSGVLADWADADQRLILGHARRCLRSDGVLLVSETLLDDDRGGPVLPALLSLTLLVGTRGRSFSARDLAALLVSEGLRIVHVHENRSHGVRDLVVCRQSSGAQ